jgi:cobalt/nickel transport system ATP-binding protein
MAPIVEVSGLRYCCPDGTRALDGIDFVLGAGESVALFGSNGSGKTTFVMHLNGLLTGEGIVKICGQTADAANMGEIRGSRGPGSIRPGEGGNVGRHTI